MDDIVRFGINGNLVEQATQSTLSDDEIDRRLVARFQAGDQQAFDEILLGHQRRVTRLVHRLLGWPADIEDVVQDVFVAALGNLHRFRSESRLSTWLTTIAVNKCRSQQRRRSLWRRGRVRLVERQRTSGNHHARDSANSHERVGTAVQTLPAKFREPIVLRYFEDMSVPEIADVLGLSTGAVEVRLSRARQRLKETLGCDDNDDAYE